MTISAFFPLLPMADSRCRGVQRSWLVVVKSQRGLERSCYDVKGRWWVVSRRRKGVSMLLGGRLQWSSQTFPDHVRLPPTVFTTTERPPNDLWRPLNVFELFKTVWNTATEFIDLPGPYTSYRPLPSFHIGLPYTTFPDHQGRERLASKSAKCDQALNNVR